MRKTPREYPNIRLDARMTQHLASYWPEYDNAIRLSKAGIIVDEEEVVLTLMHEETHWAQDMFLSPNEITKYGKNRLGSDLEDTWIVETLAEEMAYKLWKRIYKPKERSH